MIETIKNLPSTPGVYHYFDSAGKLLYVGKAKNLKNRVKSYFSFTPTLSPSPKLGARIAKMISETVSMHYIVVESENDALILENSMIKQLKPKYNILLRDDKTYPYLYVNLDDPFGRIELTRKVVKGSKIKYFGPFVSGARDLLSTLYEVFALVQKSSCVKGKKACLFHQIGRCPAPCEGKISSSDYQKILQSAMDAIDDKKFLISHLENTMQHLSEEFRFEEAAVMRDRIVAIKKSIIDTTVDLANDENFDLFAFAQDNDRVCIVKMFVREGKLSGSAHHFVRFAHEATADDIYPQALLDFYTNDAPIGCDKIIVGDDFGEKETLSSIISQKKGKKVPLIVPKVGDKKELVALAVKNGHELLSQNALQHAKQERLYRDIATFFQLQEIPQRIEVFDASHHQGENPVGSMVVWDEQWDKASYRHYTLSTKDDYSQMREMLTRRVEAFETNPPPHLWVIDGGKALIDLARDILASVGVNIDLIGVAKEKLQGRAHRAKGAAFDTLVTHNETFKLPTHDEKLHFFQRLRDEAHRFAITFHRAQKTKKQTQSHLLALKGISQGRLKKMIDYFGSFEAILHASQEELKNLFGPKEGEKIYHQLTAEISSTPHD